MVLIINAHFDLHLLAGIGPDTIERQLEIEK